MSKESTKCNEGKTSSTLSSKCLFLHLRAPPNPVFIHYLFSLAYDFVFILFSLLWLHSLVLNIFYTVSTLLCLNKLLLICTGTADTRSKHREYTFFNSYRYV